MRRSITHWMVQLRLLVQHLYTKPISISSNTTVKAIAIKDGKSSFVDEGTFTKIRDDIKLTLLTKYLPNYAGAGR